MGTYDHPSELVHRIAFPSADRAVLRTHWWLGAFPNKEGKQPVFSDPEDLDGDDPIFHSFAASGGKLTPRKTWAVIGSVTFQLLVLLALAVVPLFHVNPLPKKEMPTMLYLRPPSEVAAIRVPKPKATSTAKRTPISVPVRTTQEAPPPPADTTSKVAAGAVSGIPDAAPPEINGSRSMSLPVQTPELAPVKRIHVASGVAEANLIHDVSPEYPPEAGRERIEGTVVLLAVIGTDGAVTDVRVESGPALLAQAAIEAVKQWRYKPYMLNGVPVEIDSRITINFTMSRG
jgi:protein TonB